MILVIVTTIHSSYTLLLLFLYTKVSVLAIEFPTTPQIVELYFSCSHYHCHQLGRMDGWLAGWMQFLPRSLLLHPRQQL